VQKRQLSLAVLIVFGAYLAWGSTWTVRQNEAGVQVRFGRVVRTVPAGLHITLPWPLEKIRTVPVTEQRTMPIGFTLVDRAQGLGPRDDEVQWLTGDTNIVELQATVLYTISDPVSYLYGVSPMSDGRSRAFTIRKSCEAALTSLIAEMPIDSVLSIGKAELSRRGLAESQALLDQFELGVSVSSLNVVEVNPPLSVIAAFNDVASAKADRERLITEATGEESRLLPRARARARELEQEAETYASEVTSRARGIADGFAKLAAETEAHPDLIRSRVWHDAMERILPRVQKVVLPPNGRMVVR